MENPDSLTARFLKARYFKHMDIMDAPLGNNPSYIWRSLLWSRDILRGGMTWKVGNGETINARRDDWIPSLSTRKISSNVSFDSNIYIKDLIRNQNE